MAVTIPSGSVDESTLIISGVDNTGDAINSAKAGIKSLETTTADFESRSKSYLDRMQKHWLTWAAGIYAAQQIAVKGWQLLQEAADFEEQRGMLNNLSRQYNTTADQIVTAMQRASEGMIAKADLMQVALGGIAKGLKPEQLIELADAARILGDAVGQDATTALNNLTEALETGRARGLKTYLGTALDLKATFGDLESKMTEAEKAHAMYLITMQTATEWQMKQTNAVDDTADKMEILTAKFRDLKREMGDVIKMAAVPVGEAIYWWLTPSKWGKKETPPATPAAGRQEEELAQYRAQLDALRKLLRDRADVAKAMSGTATGGAKSDLLTQKEMSELWIKGELERYAEAEALNEQWWEQKRRQDLRNQREAMEEGYLLLRQEMADKVRAWETAAQRLKEIEAAQLKETQYYQEMRFKAYQETWAAIIDLANTVSGDLGEGARGMVSGMMGYTDTQAAYETEVESAWNHYYDMQEAYLFHKNEMFLMDQEFYELQNALDTAASRQRIATAQYTAGMLSSAMYSLYAATGKKSRELFELQKVAAIAETVISTVRAAQLAYEWGTRIGGPWVGAAMAAMATAAGLMRVAQLQSTKFEAGSAVSSPSGGGMPSTSKTETTAASTVPVERPINVSVHVYGSFYGNKDELARDIAASIRTAERDGVH